MIIAALASLTPVWGSQAQMFTPAVRASSVDYPSNDYLRQPLNLRADIMPNAVNIQSCGGMSRSMSLTPPTTVTPGKLLGLEWNFGTWTGEALHQGTICIDISRDGSEGDWQRMVTMNFNGKQTADNVQHGMDLTMPRNLVPASTPILRWIWENSLTGEKFINCADLYVAVDIIAALGSPNANQKVDGYVEGTLTQRAKLGLPTQAASLVDNAETKVGVYLGGEGVGSVGTKGEWEFCGSNAECANGCCSNKWSDDGKNKCTPGGC